MNAHTDEIIGISYSDDMNTFLTTSFDKTIREWNKETRELINLIQYKNPNYPSAFATKAIYAKKENRIFTSSIDCRINEWDISKKILTNELLGHDQAINDIVLNNDKSKLLSCSDDGTYKEWDVVTYKLLKFVHCYSGILTSIRYSPKEDKIITASQDGILKEWNSKTGDLISIKFENPIPIKKAIYSSDGKLIFCQLESSDIIIIDVETNMFEKIGGVWVIMDYCIDDNFLFAVNGFSGKITQFDALTYKRIREYDADIKNFPTSIASTKHRITVSYRDYVGDNVFQLREWDSITGKQINFFVD